MSLLLLLLLLLPSCIRGERFREFTGDLYLVKNRKKIHRNPLTVRLVQLSSKCKDTSIVDSYTFEGLNIKYQYTN